jgi:hypothetical protein
MRIPRVSIAQAEGKTVPMEGTVLKEPREAHQAMGATGDRSSSTTLGISQFPTLTMTSVPSLETQVWLGLEVMEAMAAREDKGEAVTVPAAAVMLDNQGIRDLLGSRAL